MEDGSLTALYVAGGIVQAVYYTVLIGILAARISSRIAVMEFKVDELWAASRDTDQEL